MDAKKALESLLKTMEQDLKTGEWMLKKGSISNDEHEGLAEALSALRDASSASGADASRFVAVPSSRAASLRLDSLKRTRPAKPAVLLCLDFGTAMSKAAATIGGDDSIVELPLGLLAGDKDSVYGLRSSIYISRDGKIYFGHEAVAKSIAENESGRKRLDSLKQRLSQGSLSDLSEGMLDIETNPTNVPLTQADAIVLYLAYLTDVAVSELETKPNASRYVLRRFARPCWKTDRAEWAQKELREMLALAQVIADTFHDRWAGGIPADEAKATLSEASKLGKVPDYLVGQDVEEPIAAGSSRLVSEERDRGLFVVVDVGAGTTDYAVFWGNQDPHKGIFKVWQIPGTIRALSQAGDTIDGYLSTYILEKAHLRPGSTDYPFAAANLALLIRQTKETLIRSGKVELVLSNSSPVKVSRDEFLASIAVRDFEKLLRDELIAALNAADDSWFRELASFARVGRDFVTVVLTGGGVGLPMVQRLGAGHVEVHGLAFACRVAPAVPEWLAKRYPRLAPEYPQLAVAIGGAATELPEMAPAVSNFAGMGGKTPNWEVPVQYK